MCVLVGDKWLTLREFARKSGKKTKNWRKSVKHGGVPLNDFITCIHPVHLIPQVAVAGPPSLLHRYHHPAPALGRTFGRSILSQTMGRDW